MPLLTKEALESALSAKPTLDVDIPELGGSVRIRTLSGTERERWEHETVVERKDNRSTMRARMVVLAVVGENGQPLWNELDVARLGDSNSKVLDRLYSAALEHNSLAAGSRDNALKNSGSGQTSGSGSGSQGT